MYREDEFYKITDFMHHNVYASLLKPYITKEENVIIKIFKLGDEVVVIETNNFKDTILKDTRRDKNRDLMEYDLVFLKVLNRYYSDYEINGMVYESIEGVGSWFRVKIPGFKPTDRYLKPFTYKKKINKEDLVKYASNDEELVNLNIFYDITKGLIKFDKVDKVKELFLSMEK